jgi:hypothetical protein
MSWFKLDDHFPDHPKILAAGGDAAWLWVCGGCYCARHLTDGLIPKAAVPRLSDRRNPMKLAQRLVEVGLWIDRGDHFGMHDYLEFNPSRADVEGVRDSARIRMNEARSSRERSREQDHERSDEGSREVHPSRTRTPKKTRAKYDEDFTAIWDLYPRHKAKSDASRAYNARRNEGVSHDELMLAVKHYAVECEQADREERFILYGSTFFGPNERWRDYLEPPARPATLEELASPTPHLDAPPTCPLGLCDGRGYVYDEAGAHRCEHLGAA